MKKKLLSVLLITSMAMAALSGCGNAEETVSEEVADEVVEEVVEELGIEYCYNLQVSGLDNAVLHITSVNDTGETSVEESDSYGWFGSAGGTLAQTMEEWDIESIEPVCDEFDFLGWSAYTIEYDEEDEFADEIKTPLYDGKIMTTEEIMELELPENDVYFYTEWDFTCSGCQEQKQCEVHYVDDDRYIVCSDCYGEFAYHMGLLTDGECTGRMEYECSGCEVEKDCGIYWVAEEEYLVCDDCYEEFATGMGLN